ncbi:MAG: inner membrane CreD family protein, partial [Candidatus Pacebacteria bacterium]|nr:inner membrane CreD family protein [Candidatus Paceibacterota bacterium]
MNINNITPLCPPVPSAGSGRNKNMSFKNSARSSILIKMFAIGVLAMLLLIPTGMIKSLINERSMRESKATLEVSNKWGNKQVIAGPVLTIPYTVTSEIISQSKDGETKVQEVVNTSYVSFLPE